MPCSSNSAAGHEMSNDYQANCPLVEPNADVGEVIGDYIFKKLPGDTVLYLKDRCWILC